MTALDKAGLVALAGLRVITSPLLTEPCEDFSRSRSPSRALRRWKSRGIQGRGRFERPSRKVLHTGGMIICHPFMYAEIMRAIAAGQP